MGLLDTLVRTESGGNWAAQNNVTGAGGMSGHFGRLQFGQARLQDAMRAGVLPQGTTPQQFMADPALQQAVERWHFSDIDQQAARMGLDRYLGQSVGGIPITQDAIRAMAHLGGIGGAQRFLESGGQYNPSDAYGTSLADYATTHGGSGNTALQGGEGNDTMAQAPQQTQRPSIWDNVPFLADADRRARLQIGLEGMTLNPNQALIQGAQGGIDRRAEQAQLNQTAEWLNAQPGGQQFAQALMSGIPADQVFGAYMQSLQAPSAPDPIVVNGQLVDPSTGAVIGDYRTPEQPDPGYRPLTPEEVAAFPGLDPTKAYQVSPDGEIKPIGSGGVNVNVDAGETAFDKATGEALANEAKTVVEQGAIAQRNLGTLGSLEAALANAPQGAVGALANMAGSLGIKTEGSSDLEVANALISQLVPQQRAPGSGQMSDRDVQLFKESLPRLINTPEGNRKIIQTMRAVAEYDVARGEIARRLQLRQITPTEADTEYRALGNPLAEYAKGLPQDTTAPASTADAEWQDMGGGVRLRVIGQ